jgi:hypothetical protein
MRDPSLSPEMYPWVTLNVGLSLFAVGLLLWCLSPHLLGWKWKKTRVVNEKLQEKTLISNKRVRDLKASRDSFCLTTMIYYAFSYPMLNIGVLSHLLKSILIFHGDMSLKDEELLIKRGIHLFFSFITSCLRKESNRERTFQGNSSMMSVTSFRTFFGYTSCFHECSPFLIPLELPFASFKVINCVLKGKIRRLRQA